MTTTAYGDKSLEPKVFHTYILGGWHDGCSMDFSDHTKMRLYDVRGWLPETASTPSISLTS